MSGVDSSVIVVGAGPVGLATAIDLALRGVEVTVLERRTRQTEHTKATTIWPRQIELLARLGVDTEIIDAGQRLTRVTLNTPRRQFAAFGFENLVSAPFRFGIGLAQTSTERILEKRAKDVGVNVERGISVVGVTQDDHEVKLQCSASGEDVHVRTARWLIAADGAHSDVRRWADIRMLQTGGAVRFAVTDAYLQADLSDSDVAYYYATDGAVGVVPFGNSKFRIAMGVPAHADKPPKRSAFEQVLRNRAGIASPLEGSSWSSVFDVRFGHAEAFRRGRIILAGDAAHTLSPAGGQGMNTGLQDSANLSWKLADVIRGRADTALLDSYQAERLPDYLRSAKTSSRMTLLGLKGFSSRKAAARTYFAVGAQIPPLRQRIAASMAQLESAYAEGAAHPLVGRRFPSAPTQAAAAHSRLPYLDPISGGDIHWAGRGSTRPETASTPDSHPATLYASDLPPRVGRRLGATPRLFDIRPDGHLRTSRTIPTGKSS